MGGEKLRRVVLALSICVLIVGAVKVWDDKSKGIEFSPDNIDTYLVGEVEYIV